MDTTSTNLNTLNGYNVTSNADPRSSLLYPHLRILQNVDERLSIRQKAGNALVSFFTDLRNQNFCRSNYERVFPAIKPLLNDRIPLIRTLAARLIGLFAATLNPDYSPFIFEFFPYLMQSKQIEKRLARFCILHEFIQVCDLSLLVPYIDTILVHIIHLITDTRQIESFVPQILAIWSKLGTVEPCEPFLAHYDVWLRTIFDWIAQDSIQPHVMSILSHVAQLAHLIQKQVHFTIDFMLHFLKDLSKTISHSPTVITNSSLNCKLVINSSTILPFHFNSAIYKYVMTRHLMLFPSLIVAMDATLFSTNTVNHPPSQPLLSIFLHCCKAIHKLQYGYHHRSHWSLACNAMLAEWIEIYTKHNQLFAKQSIAISHLFQMQLSSENVPRTSKLVQLLQSQVNVLHIAKFNTIHKDFILNILHPSLAIMRIHIDPNVIRIVYSIIIQLIQSANKLETRDWLLSLLIEHVHAAVLHTNGFKSNLEASPSFWRTMSSLMVSNSASSYYLSLLLSLISYFKGEEDARQLLSLLMDIFEKQSLANLSINIQIAWINCSFELIKTSKLHLHDIPARFFTSTLVQEEAITMQTRIMSLKLVAYLIRHSSTNYAIAGQNVSSVDNQSLTIEEILNLVFKLAIHVDERVRLEAVKVMLAVVKVDTRGLSKSLSLIQQHIFIHGLLQDYSSQVRSCVVKVLTYCRFLDCQEVDSEFKNWPIILRVSLFSSVPAVDIKQNEFAIFDYFVGHSILTVDSAQWTRELTFMISHLDIHRLVRIFHASRVSLQLKQRWMKHLPPLVGDLLDLHLKETKSIHPTVESMFSTFFSTLIDSTHRSVELWALYEVVIYCLTSKLKTGFLVAKESLQAIERMILAIPSYPQINLLSASNAIEQAQFQSNAISHPRWCLRLSDLLEKAVYIMIDSNVIMSSNSTWVKVAPFFINNHRVCRDWYHKIRGILFQASISCNSPYDALQHGYEKLVDLGQQIEYSPLSMQESFKEFEIILFNVVSQLLHLNDSDSISGLSTYVYYVTAKLPLDDDEYTTRMNQTMSAAKAQSLNQIETALDLYLNLLAQFSMSQEVNPQSSTQLEETQWIRSQRHFIVQQSAHCCRVLGEWTLSLPKLTPYIDLLSPSKQSILHLIHALEEGNHDEFETKLLIAQESTSHLPSSDPQTYLFQSQLSFYESIRMDQSQSERALTCLNKARTVLEIPFSAIASPISSALIQPFTTQLHFIQLAESHFHRNEIQLTQSVELSSFQSFETTLHLARIFKILKQDDLQLEFDYLLLARMARKNANLRTCARFLDRVKDQFDITMSVLERIKLWKSQGEVDLAHKTLLQHVEFIVHQLGTQSQAKPIYFKFLNLADKWFHASDQNPLSHISFSLSTSINHIDYFSSQWLMKLTSELNNHNQLDLWLVYGDWNYSRGTRLIASLEKMSFDEVIHHIPASTLRKLDALNLDNELKTSLLKLVVDSCISGLVNPSLSSIDSQDCPNLIDDPESTLACPHSSPGWNQLLDSSSTLSPQTRQRCHTILGQVRDYFLSSFSTSVTAYCKYLVLRPLDATESSITTTITLRLLHFLARYGDQLYNLSYNLHLTPTSSWCTIIPQVLARLGHFDPFVRLHVYELLARIGQVHLPLIIYPVLARLNSKHDKNLSDLGSLNHIPALLKRIKAQLMSTFSNIVSQVEIMFRELFQITTLWDERIWVKLNDISNHLKLRIRAVNEETQRLQYTTLSANFNVDQKCQFLLEKYETIIKPTRVKFERLIVQLSTLPKSKAEHVFQTYHLAQFQYILQLLASPKINVSPDGNVISISSLDVILSFLTNIIAQLHRSVKQPVLKLTHISPELAQLRHMNIPLPGVHGEELFIENFNQLVHLLPTKTRPKKLSILASDGKNYTYLLKGHADLHLDECIMQFIRIVNQFLAKDNQTRRRQLACTAYAVIPIGLNSGLIQWVDGTVSFNHIVTKRTKLVPTTGIKSNREPGQAVDSLQLSRHCVVQGRPIEMFYDKLLPQLAHLRLPNVMSRADWPLDVLKRIYLELVNEMPADIIHCEIWSSSSCAQEFFDKTTQFSRSNAVISIVGYIIGLGDRHLENILLHYTSGRVLHIDYDVSFEMGAKLPVPELVPFRLTPNMIRALGHFGLNGSFRVSSEHVLRVLRHHCPTLLTLFEAFVYDPLIYWSLDKAALEECKMELTVTLELLTDRLSTLSNDLLTRSQQFGETILPLYRAANIIFDYKLMYHNSQQEMKNRQLEKNQLSVQSVALESKRDELTQLLAQLVKQQKNTSNQQELEVVTSQAKERVAEQSKMVYEKLIHTLESFREDSGLQLIAPLPQLLQPNSITRPLTHWKRVFPLKDWPYLQQELIDQFVVKDDRFEAVWIQCESIYQRCINLLTTYRSVLMQLPSNYVTSSKYYQWQIVLEPFLLNPNHSNLQRLEAFYYEKNQSEWIESIKKEHLEIQTKLTASKLKEKLVSDQLAILQNERIEVRLEKRQCKAFLSDIQSNQTQNLVLNTNSMPILHVLVQLYIMELIGNINIITKSEINHQLLKNQFESIIQRQISLISTMLPQFNDLLETKLRPIHQINHSIDNFQLTFNQLIFPQCLHLQPLGLETLQSVEVLENVQIVESEEIRFNCERLDRILYSSFLNHLKSNTDSNRAKMILTLLKDDQELSLPLTQKLIDWLIQFQEGFFQLRDDYSSIIQPLISTLCHADNGDRLELEESILNLIVFDPFNVGKVIAQTLLDQSLDSIQHWWSQFYQTTFSNLLQSLFQSFESTLSSTSSFVPLGMDRYSLQLQSTYGYLKRYLDAIEKMVDLQLQIQLKQDQLDECQHEQSLIQEQLVAFEWQNEHSLDQISRKLTSSQVQFNSPSQPSTSHSAVQMIEESALVTSSIRKRLLGDLQKMIAKANELIKSLILAGKDCLNLEDLLIAKMNAENINSSPDRQMSLEVLKSGSMLRVQTTQLLQSRCQNIIQLIGCILEFEISRVVSPADVVGISVSLMPTLMQAWKRYLFLGDEHVKTQKVLNQIQVKVNQIQGQIGQVTTDLEVDARLLKRLKEEYHQTKKGVVTPLQQLESFFIFDEQVTREVESLIHYTLKISEKWQDKSVQLIHQGMKQWCKASHAFHILLQPLNQLVKYLRQVVDTGNSGTRATQIEVMAVVQEDRSNESAHKLILLQTDATQLLIEFRRVAQDWLEKVTVAGNEKRLRAEREKSYQEEEIILSQQIKEKDDTHQSAMVGQRDMTLQVIKRVEEKLNGRDLNLVTSKEIVDPGIHIQPSPTSSPLLEGINIKNQTPMNPLSIQDHVDLLIHQATNQDLLARMYEGWTAWI